MNKLLKQEILEFFTAKELCRFLIIVLTCWTYPIFIAWQMLDDLSWMNFNIDIGTI